MTRPIFALACALVCAPAAFAQSAKSSSDQAFDAIYARFAEGYKRADPRLVAALYTNDAFYLQPGHAITRGRDSVLSAFSFLNSFKDKPAGGPAIGFEIVDRQISGNIGWDIGYFKMRGDGKPISASDPAGGKFIVLWKRGTDGQWRIFADGYSNVEQAETADPERAAAEKAVARAVNAYIDGVMNSDSVQLDIAFHPDAFLSAALPNGRVYRAPYSQWRGFTTRPKEDPAGKVNRIVNMEIMGNAAVATTVLDWPTVRYVDYLSLIKTGADEWKIVSKIWHQEAKRTSSN